MARIRLPREIWLMIIQVLREEANYYLFQSPILARADADRTAWEYHRGLASLCLVNRLFLEETRKFLYNSVPRKITIDAPGFFRDICRHRALSLQIQSFNMCDFRAITRDCYKDPLTELVFQSHATTVNGEGYPITAMSSKSYDLLKAILGECVRPTGNKKKLVRALAIVVLCLATNLRYLRLQHVNYSIRDLFDEASCILAKTTTADKEKYRDQPLLNLKEIIIDIPDNDMKSITDIETIIKHPRLQYIRLQRVTWRKAEVDALPGLVLHPEGVEVLDSDIDEVGVAHVLESCRKLKSLAIYYWKTWNQPTLRVDMTEMGNVLRRLGENITTLALFESFSSRYGICIAGKIGSLSSLTKLKTLCIKYHFLKHTPACPSIRDGEHNPAPLTELLPISLEELMLVTEGSRIEEELASLDVARLMMCDNFERLRYVDILGENAVVKRGDAVEAKGWDSSNPDGGIYVHRERIRKLGIPNPENTRVDLSVIRKKWSRIRRPKYGCPGYGLVSSNPSTYHDLLAELRVVVRYRRWRNDYHFTTS